MAQPQAAVGKSLLSAEALDALAAAAAAAAPGSGPGGGIAGT